MKPEKFILVSRFRVRVECYIRWTLTLEDYKILGLHSCRPNASF